MKLQKITIAPCLNWHICTKGKGEIIEIYKDKKGEFRFRLKAKNGEIIAVGEGYTTKVSCNNGIASVQKNAVDAEIVEE